MAGKNGSSKSGPKKNGSQRKAGGAEGTLSQARKPTEGGEGNPAAQAVGPKAPGGGGPAADGKRPSRKKGLTGLEAAARVLAESGKPMRCGELAVAVIEKGLWKTGGKTPAATLNSAILREIRAKGAASRFRQAGPGLFGAMAAKP